MTKTVHTPATYADIEVAPEHVVAEIIDGVLQKHQALRLEIGRYALNGVATGDDVVRFEPFPTYSFPLWELWDVHPRSKRWAN